MKQNKLLIIGGITWKNTNHPSLGGTTVLMDNFINYCKKNNIPHIVIPTNKYNGHLKGARNMIVLLASFFKYAKRGDVAMVNISSRSGLVTLLPIIECVSKLKGVEVACRKFAGSVHRYLSQKPLVKKIAIYCLKKTKVSFFETEELVSWFANNGYQGEWFPNVREATTNRVPMNYAKRFVFVSQVFEDKGVDILLNLSNKLPNDYVIDIYGPIRDEKYNDDYFCKFRANYKGLLKPEEVTSKLAEYNIMIFPTWWHSEGYPGVIIEAFSVGMPIISTNIGGIPELVEDGISGIIVPVKDSNSLEKAILSIDEKYYQELRNGAEHRFDTYNSEIVNPRIVKRLLGDNWCE